jgi:hypothetical protein
MAAAATAVSSEADRTGRPRNDAGLAAKTFRQCRFGYSEQAFLEAKYP